MTFRKIFKGVNIFILSILGSIVLYFIIAVLFTLIPVKGAQVIENDVYVYLLTNGVHSDLAVPVRNEFKDWTKEIKFLNSPGSNINYNYLAFGWGDKGFYLETPTWADLKFHTAFNAIFGLSSSAVHATYYKHLNEGDNCIKLTLSRMQYVRLVNYIESTFTKDINGHIQQVITNSNYGLTDAFYEAKGSYNLFKTCNTWTNNGLKVCGQKSCLWTPFDVGMFWHNRKK